MPAKKRITREAIIQTAIGILREEGYERLNTRNIAQRLKCSTQPIYSEFGNMEELKAELKKKAEQCYVETVQQYRVKSEYSAYMAYGLGFIRFARDEKQLFRYLYMCDRHGEGQTIDDVNAPGIIGVLTEQYGFPEETALCFHYDMAIYCYGLAVMLNTSYMEMDETEIIERLGAEFYALADRYGLCATERRAPSEPGKGPKPR